MIQKVGVVGAGLMGSEIALVFALAGKDVLLNDTTGEGLQRATDNLAKILEKGVARGFYQADEVQWTLGRLKATTDLASFADRDLVIEWSCPRSMDLDDEDGWRQASPPSYLKESFSLVR